jgi:endonuclease-8
MWLALEVSDTTVCNVNGQVLRVLDANGLQSQLDALGADVMSSECTREEMIHGTRQHDTVVGDVLLNQSVLSGIGNVAKSESLFLAGVHPEATASALASQELARLTKSIRNVMWESYHAGRRWTHRVYRRASMKCYECGNRIVMIRQGKRRRSTYFCPSCQRA